MNKAFLMGRLTNDPNCTILPNGTAMAKFSLAVDRRFAKEGEKDVDFINCVGWGKTAENIGKYWHKGMKALVEGRIQTGSYEKDGQTHYTTDIVVENIEFCEKKSDSPAPAVPAPSSDEWMDIPDGIEDLPFN